MADRLQKILSEHGVCSRREAEKWIEQGRVTVNGIPASLGLTADPEMDLILVDGKPLRSVDEKVVIMLNKPRGYVTTMSDEKGRPTAASLVADCGVRVYPVGRLDMDSEGLLLFTNDGALANYLTHPKHQVDKTYRVWVREYAPGKEERLLQPMELDGWKLQTPRVQLLHAQGTHAQLLITIHEGRNRQVRRMCRIAGMYVCRLRRIREGELSLDDLPVGKWRYLTSSEIETLKK